MDNHTVTIDNRTKMMMTDIVEVDSFDEEEIRATLKEGAMIIKGEKLHIQVLDLSAGRAEIAGMINSIIYVKVKPKSEKGILARIVK